MKFWKATEQHLRGFSFPAWLFAALTVLYNEMLLHLWTAEQLLPGRILNLMLLSLAFGGIPAILTSLFSKPKAGKVTAMLLSGLVTLVYLLEFFLSDAYQNFMPFRTVVIGAGGIAQDYFGLVMELLLHDLWRILLAFGPVILYGIWGRNIPTGWKTRGILTAGTAACFGAALMAIHLGGSAGQLNRAFDFDTSVRTFGLPMTLVLDLTQNTGETAPEFSDPVVLPTETQATESAP